MRFYIFFLKNQLFKIGQGSKIQFFIKNSCFLKSYGKMVGTVRIFRKFPILWGAWQLCTTYFRHVHERLKFVKDQKISFSSKTNVFWRATAKWWLQWESTKKMPQLRPSFIKIGLIFGMFMAVWSLAWVGTGPAGVKATK